MTKLSTRNGCRFSCGCDPPTFEIIAGAKLMLPSPRYGETFELALEEVRSSTIFTTHTPVPAGHDAFPFNLVETHLAGAWGTLGQYREALGALGMRVALFGGQVWREVRFVEYVRVIHRERLLEGLIRDAVHHILIGVPIIEKVDHVIAGGFGKFHIKEFEGKVIVLRSLADAVDTHPGVAPLLGVGERKERTDAPSPAR